MSEIVYCEVWPKENDELLAFDGAGKPFHIGQCYQKEKAQPLKCKKCGGNEFHIGQGHYYTAVRCVRCEWECCIHQN